MFREEEYITLAALQHMVFCPRQCALINTEQAWAENGLTTLGHIEHERVDSSEETIRGAIRTSRSVQLVCHRLGIRGVADVVEYKTSFNGITITPIEYKHGRPKEHRADEVQLCAQAFCLEEMHNCQIENACLFYHSIRHRCMIKLDEELRELTEKTIRDTRKLLLSGVIPPAIRSEHCNACSLFDYCLPRSSEEPASVYTNRIFDQMLGTL